ncbi:hypothetical protein [Leifsonia sp. PS1209]|uniref:hypothetical protein n=1 Tax=Leifsonia sp. PS1209 TaxID=2724914 RepID=UPI001442DAF6|nr:hypothetical protein [Leifsonia sp. PS1209]QIZ97586.1 hypothetical protein HF024_02960 [Leifsonia sp. PS1209]
MAKYVDVFGSWEDAVDVAKDVRENTSRFAADGRRFSLLGLTATVLGLNNADGYDGLFEEAVTGHPLPSEAFFWGLRWASIEAKRRGRLDTASQIAHRALARMETQIPDSYDRNVMQGMAYNFQALLALRNSDVESAHQLVDRAIDKFGDDPSHASLLPRDEAARYAWMAKLNRAQLPLLSGDYDGARAQLDALLIYAREYDPSAVHTTLSALALTYLKSGNAAEARPLLLESLDLLAVEYDPNVVRQVRKMLFATYSMLGAEASAKRVAADSSFFWRSTRAVERYEP